MDGSTETISVLKNEDLSRAEALTGVLRERECRCEHTESDTFIPTYDGINAGINKEAAVCTDISRAQRSAEPISEEMGLGRRHFACVAGKGAGFHHLKQFVQ